MKKIILAAIAVSLVAAGAVSAGSIDRHWKGYIYRSKQYSSMYIARKIEIFEDNNGCQYLVISGGSLSSSASYGVSMTPRINSATRQPHCA